ncbi:MATE family efflux transporter [Actinoplanes sp. G11-F43]|uniref:MATE family efflux transporter n=1 Tax=Actinoplanes sp. G11-F43 TaxID=3424130 RepID=UPI003D344963
MTSATLIRPALRLSGSILVGLSAGLILHLFTLAFLGRLGEDALYVRAIFTPFGFLILAVVEGVVVAAQVSAGIATRSGRRDVLRPLPTFLAVGGGVLVLIAALFTAGSGPILNALEVRPELRPDVVTFVVTVCLATVVSLLPYAGAALLRGIGRTGTSSMSTVGFTVLSMVLTVSLAPLGVLAVPAATAVAGVIAGVAVLVPLRGHAAGRPWLRRDAAAGMWTLGAPVAVTFLLLSTVNFGYLWVLRDATAADVAGFNLGQGAITFVMVVALAVGSGTAVAVNLRPGEVRRPIEAAGLSAAVRMTLPAYAVIGLLTWAARDPVSRLLTTDPEVARVTAEYFQWMGPTFLVFGGTLAVLTYLEQIGHARIALLLNVVYFAVLLVIAVLLPAPVTALTMTKLLAAGNAAGFLTCWLSARYLLSRSPAAGPRSA